MKNEYLNLILRGRDFMRTTLSALLILTSTPGTAAWNCGDSPCPGNLCVKDPKNGDYCLKGFVGRIDSKGNIYLAENRGRRVQKFRPVQ
jgi:hypothetical protein